MANGREDREEKKPESQPARIIKVGFFAILMVALIWSFKKGQEETERQKQSAKPDAAQVKDGGHD